MVFNPSRFSLARRRRGLTRTALAEKIEVERKMITAYESGKHVPATDTMNRIVAVLGFPEVFFAGDDLDEPSLDSGSFRSMSKMTAPQRDMALSQAALGLHFSNWLEKRFGLPCADLPDMSRHPNPEAAADALRREWALGSLSVRNMIHLLESRGIRVFSLAVDAREVDAFSMWKGSVPFVFLNTMKTAEHSRFDAAHELGHLVLHKHGPPQGIEAEKDANAFASSFLMPRGAIVATAPRFPTYSSLVAAKQAWGVSVSALAYRLHDLGLMTDWQYRGVCIEVARRGRSVEPNEMPRESSLVLPKVLGALAADGIGRARIAHDLSIPASELEQLLFGLAITSVDGGRGGAPKTPSAELKRVK